MVLVVIVTGIENLIGSVIGNLIGNVIVLLILIGSVIVSEFLDVIARESEYGMMTCEKNETHS